MESSADSFKNAIDKAFTTEPGVKLNSDTMGDAIKYKSGFTEEKTEDESNNNQKEMVDGIIEIVKKVKNLENRKTIANDMIKKFKKENIKIDFNNFLKSCGIIKDKVEAIEATGTGSSGGYSAPLFSGEEIDLEKAETKEQKSKTKKKEAKEATGSGSSGAFSGPVAFKDSQFVRNSFKETPKLEEQRRRKTMKASKEVKNATNNEGNTFKVGDKAKTYDRKENITIRALWEKNGRIKAFYMIGNNGHEIDIDGLDPIKEQVEKVEAKEATTSGSVGGYESPSMWAKSTKKKDWGPSRKTQIPGGGFVKIKKKCTKFPYCNQGDINNLKISKNESVKEAIENVAKKMGVNKTVIMTILEHEYEKMNKRTK